MRARRIRDGIERDRKRLNRHNRPRLTSTTARFPTQPLRHGEYHAPRKGERKRERERKKRERREKDTKRHKETQRDTETKRQRECTDATVLGPRRQSCSQRNRPDRGHAMSPHLPAPRKGREGETEKRDERKKLMNSIRRRKGSKFYLSPAFLGG